MTISLNVSNDDDTCLNDDEPCSHTSEMEHTAGAHGSSNALADAVTSGVGDAASSDDDEFVYSNDEVDGDDVDWEDVTGAAVDAPQVSSTDDTSTNEHDVAATMETVTDDHESDPDDFGDDDDDNDDAFKPDDDDDDDASMDEENSADDDESSDHNERIVTDLQRVNWEQVNQALQQEAAAATKTTTSTPKKRKAVRMTKDDKARELVLHQTHILLLLATQLEWNALCQSPVLRGLLLSLTGGSANGLNSVVIAELQRLQRPQQSPRSTQAAAAAGATTYALEQLVRWFTQHFRVTSATASSSSTTTARLSEARLLDVFFDRQGCATELAVLFTVLCRALQLCCRLTCALDALLLSDSRAFEAAAGGASALLGDSATANAIKQQRVGSTRKRARNSSNYSSNNSSARDNASHAPSCWIWTEVLDATRRVWIPVDVQRRVVGRPHAIEALRSRGVPFSYVVSVTASARVADVTPRYATKWSKSLARRLANDWVRDTLDALNADADAKADAASRRGVSPSVYAPLSRADETAVLADEQAALAALTAREAMPTSVEGFKKHPVFCLERHVARTACVYPRKAVGLFQGQPVFLRTHVHVVRSVWQWRRLGRVVRDSEQRTPAKWHARGGKAANDTNNESKHASDDDDDKDDGDDSTRSRNGTDPRVRALFGVWQTDAFVAPSVVDGVVPKNEYRNIEVWSAAHVPRGGVHVQLPRIDAVARELGLDFAPAVVGFEVKDDRNVPVVDGIVVAESALELLLDAHAHIQQRTIERAIAKNASIVAKRWERLVTRLLLRQRLEDDYGAVGR